MRLAGIGTVPEKGSWGETSNHWVAAEPSAFRQISNQQTEIGKHRRESVEYLHN